MSFSTSTLTAPPLLCRPARARDAQAISELTHRLAPQTVARSVAHVRAHLDEFDVVRDPQTGAVLACAAVRPLDDERAELRSLAVSPDARGLGLGSRILRRALRRAYGQDRRLYCVTVCPDFFERHGFERVPLDRLPSKPSRGRRVAGRERVALAGPPVDLPAEARRALRA